MLYANPGHQEGGISWEGQAYVLVKPSTDQQRLTHFMEGNMLYSVYRMVCLSHPKKTLTEVSRNFDQILSTIWPNRDGVITHLEPDILECEVKWSFVSLWTKLVELMEFQLSYFKSYKMIL